MTEDRRRPAQYTSVRDDRLRRWLGTTVRSYSSALGTLPPVDIDALGDGRSFVLEPGETGFGRSAPIVDESPCPTCGRTTPRVEPRGRFR